VRREGLFPTRILLATNGSAEAVLAEAAAAELAAGTGSELHIVYVVSTMTKSPYPRAAAREQADAMLERRRLAALKVLDLRVRRVEELGVASRRPTTGRGIRRRRSSASAKGWTLA
jgi:nucleotide-binding universal stress UspA family protein